MKTCLHPSPGSPRSGSLAVIVWAAWVCGSAGVVPAANHSSWENSVVIIEANRKHYDYQQPWSASTESAQKSGLVVAGHRILTTAESLNDLTLVRLQKKGRGPWYNGKLEWIDYHANLALITTEDNHFWTGLQPVRLAGSVPLKHAAQIVRWRNGNLELRKAEINRLTLKRGKISSLDLPHLEIDSEINGAGWAEAIVVGSRVVGLMCAQDGNVGSAIPAPFIRSILESRSKQAYPGLGYFDFIWQKIANPAIPGFLKLPGEMRGVIVSSFVNQTARPSPLKAHDLILEIDGFKIDSEGDYEDPIYGKLCLENLASKQRWAGASVPMKIWRDGQLLEMQYPLAKADFAAQLVPEAVFDREPEFLMVGGLVFQPLTEPYLQSWGSDWRRKAPFRLAFYNQEEPSPERPALVFLSTILPDPCNLGYQDHRFLVLDKVNGQKVNRLPDLVTALQKPSAGYHLFEFRSGETVRRLVLDAQQAKTAAQQIMQRYGLEKDRMLVER